LVKGPVVGWRRATPPPGSVSDTPPEGAIGYYSDAAQHAAAVVLSAMGRRLFLEFDADDVIRSNVTTYIYGRD
jgi:hypothetical protein